MYLIVTRDRMHAADPHRHRKHHRHRHHGRLAPHRPIPWSQDIPKANAQSTKPSTRAPAIRAKAVELGNNPVAIFNWVRNSIEYAPTAGAIQSAQDTLDKKRGNATDTASLRLVIEH